MSRRIETTSSRTAEWTCICRAASYLDTRKQYKSGDWIALRMLPLYVQILVKSGISRRILTGIVFPKGMYEYVTARTKYIDDVFQNARKDGSKQLLILGAGYDSRVIRFPAVSGESRVFELDAPHTQDSKIKQYRRRQIPIPPDLVFIPIDFERQTLSERLSESEFQKGVKSLFLLEGLTMYLEPETIDQTFSVIGEYAGKGSRVVFDYIHASVVRGEGLYYGESDIRKTVMRVGEQWLFGMEREGVDAFLGRYGFKLVEHQDAKELENRYFRTAEGTIVGRVNGTHCIVIGEKS